MPTIDLRALPIAITGASSGIGMATAFACARAGMPVALGARRLDRLESVAARIRAEGGRAIAIPCDVSRREDCIAFVDRAASELGPLYAVFANAGYGIEAGALEMTDAEWEAMFQTNFWGTLWTVRAAVEHMRRTSRESNAGAGRPAGHVLVCSSCLSKIGTPYHGAYSATKACQDHLARALRHELQSERIHVSSVHPVQTKTEFFDHLTANSPHSRGLSTGGGNAFVQPPERVADAIVRCLRRPQGEVWTSTIVRLALAVATALPGRADRGMARVMRKRVDNVRAK